MSHREPLPVTGMSKHAPFQVTLYPADELFPEDGTNMRPLPELRLVRFRLNLVGQKVEDIIRK